MRFKDHRVTMRLLTTAALACGIALQVSGADDPFSGTWKLDLSKSKLPPPAPRGQTTRIEAEAASIRIIVDGTDAKGEPFKVIVNAGFGETTYAVMNLSEMDTVSFGRVNSHTMTVEAREDGLVVTRGTAMVSKNGRTLKVMFLASDTKGKESKAVAVLEKQ